MCLENCLNFTKCELVIIGQFNVVLETNVKTHCDLKNNTFFMSA